ncbi:MAG: phosphoribosylamine--glycine ligase [Candidatus Buchananbacteria bacterium]|nr:phosphoribosylamine--glycine ligase [Candidatus Buchananbacteria bacterium]
MNILIIGSGGREHALAWKLKQSPKVKKIFIAPGNAGTSACGENVSLDTLNHQTVIDFSKQHEIGLIVIGPDDVLASGLVNALQNSGIKVFGPTKEAAEIEWSKSFAKNLMKHLNIPTADSVEFTEIEIAKKYAREHIYPLVIKAGGLALGKGVIIADFYDQAVTALENIMTKKVFGAAGDTVIIEEFLQGEEISVHAFCDGNTAVMFPSAQDHKSIFDGDKGPNTGGMGTVAPVPTVSESILLRIECEVVLPILRELKDMGRPFKGILFPGIMLTKDGPKVLEFNARFGDPETQSYVRILKTDLLEILLACVDGKLDELQIEWEKNMSSCCVVLASKGYPGDYQKGLPITGITEAEKMEDIVVFHAGTKLSDNRLITNGGRVLGISATGNILSEAVEKTYRAVEIVDFAGKQYRKDIA